MSFRASRITVALALLVPLFFWTVRGRWRRRKRWQSLAQRGRPSRDGTPAIVAVACVSDRRGHPTPVGKPTLTQPSARP